MFRVWELGFVFKLRIQGLTAFSIPKQDNYSAFLESPPNHSDMFLRDFYTAGLYLNFGAKF